MVSGKPPRRSKTSDEPVTIDLQADKAEQKTEPASEPADLQTPPTDAQPSANNDAKAATDSASDTTSDVSSDVTPDHAVEQRSEQADKAESEPAKDPTADVVSDDGRPGGDSNAEEAHVTRPAAAVETYRGPKTSSLVASGIVGGLVALLLAGSMQYAGIIPGLGQPETAPASDAVDPQEIADIRSEIARLSQAPAPTAEPDTALIERIDALENSIRQQPDMPAIDPAAIETLRAEIATNQQTMAELRTQLETAVQSQTQTEARLAQAEEKLNEPRSDVELARAIALTSLKTAIERGGPFLSELDALKAVAPDDPAIASLQPFAANGVPSRSDLTSRFSSVADDILIAVNQPGSGETWTERLMSSARSVISVRPVGNVEGSTPEAIVARIEDKLRNGDLKGAYLEWEALPDAGKTASSQFAEKLSQRIEIETLINSAVARSIAGTEG